jgi:hypothetical protein
MEQLLQKLMVSKKIMDKHNSMSRGQNLNTTPNTPELQNFDMPQARYNIPQEFLSESSSQVESSNAPRENTKPVGVPTLEAIQKSKLPDEIKKLMMEHPIAQPQQPVTTLSNDLIEKASRLMKSESNSYIPESAKPKTQKIETQSSSTIDYNILKKIITETVESVLKENGVIVESTEKSNEIFSFKVGKHLFEGKITRIKKLS